LTAYNPEATEDAIYTKWLESGFFNPDNCPTDPEKEPFSIILPPPNETGVLHIGHAAMLSIQDIIVRQKRMSGHPTVWIPGTDHAAIATDSKVKKMLSKKGIRWKELGQEKFLAEVDAFTAQSRGTILTQVKRMGASVDWSRQVHTLDKVRTKAVYEAFKKLHSMGLIAQGDRIVNWDPKGQTVIANAEIVHKEEITKFYYFQYGPFVIGTARPETKFADKYIIVHPEDPRYQDYQHMQEFEIEWINGPIKATLIKDETADIEKGSGAMTITPWHSQIDFDLAEKYNLPKEQIIDKYGKLLPVCGEEFQGLKIAAAREAIVAKLESKGLVVKIDETYEHQLPTAERGGGIIEPQIMKQWFIETQKEFTLEHSEMPGIDSGSTQTIQSIMQHVVHDGTIQIFPKRFEKWYFNWVNNLRNWCISRQIWYGHKIPVWYKNKGTADEETVVSQTSPGEAWDQDPDTLDTWFSAGIMTLADLGWPDKTPDFKKYHPTSLLETGYDILTFWVIRMVLMSTTLTGQIPFKHIYLHGMVRDGKGQKISKSLGNNIDPVDLIGTYGADALRMGLIIGTAPGIDFKLSEDKVRAYKKFANKLWNISRFVLENSEPHHVKTQPKIAEKHKIHLAELDALTEEITKNFSEYKLYLAGEKLYHYIWHEFADVIIETCKHDLQEGEQHEVTSAQYLLRKTLDTSLRLLHPFMPYITEEIWGELYHHDTLLIATPWPSSSQS
jgi:valyl-tRNA synthetase